MRQQKSPERNQSSLTLLIQATRPPGHQATRPPGHQATKDLTDRLILRLINEAVACLREGVVADEDLLDAGVIFGTGLAPFRGGPMRYVHGRGENEVKHRLEQLKRQHGQHFQADDGWVTVG